jgi:chloramphenicol 3-O-phosphotransferase
MDRRFVIVSGVPGSGKSSLARQLAPALSLPLLDKDAILERLFDLKGWDGAASRRALSRESDSILQNKAAESHGAILVSHWRLPGMSTNSGTPTNWIAELNGKVVTVHCICSAEIAAERFVRRRRHPGHGDHERLDSEILASIREVAALGRLDFGHLVEVDTEKCPDRGAVLRDIRQAFERSSPHVGS